jgi:NAD(P)-dependent dehydrogenase (short-subunit alcohol dehydrogenase family)
VSGEKVAVVTGSASGMGAATVRLLRQRGWRVVGVDRRDADVVADLGEPAGRVQAVNGAVEVVAGPLHGVATFAGVSGFGGRPGRQVAAVDYFGAVEILDGLRPLLAEGRGAGVAISSNAATTAPMVDEALIDACLAADLDAVSARADEVGGPGAYAAAKFALARWVRRVAPTDEWVGEGISLNVVAPGQVDTPLVDEMRQDEVGRTILERSPLPAGRAARPDEVAALTAFLLSDDARFMVGSIIHIDGGADASIRPDDWPSRRLPRSKH